MVIHYSITEGDASKRCFIHYVHECIISNKPISLIAIGGVAALNDCLRQIEQCAKKAELQLNGIDIRITSVEASLYPITPIENVTPVVNHNPAINPGVESITERLKAQLKSYGATIQHRSLFSQYHGEKISRKTFAAVSVSDHHQQKTKLMAALEARYGKLIMDYVLQSTAQYPVVSEDFHTTSPLTSHSSFLHDLKAYYLSGLDQGVFLKQQKRLGLMTDNGRIFFSVSDDDIKSIGIKSLVSQCKAAYPDIKWLHGDGDEDILVDQRTIIDPACINLFEAAFLQWLKNSPSINRPNSMIITDIGHGGSGTYACQDWDDPLVVLERLREIQYSQCKTIHIMLSQEGRDIGNRLTYTLGLIDRWVKKNQACNLTVKLIIPPSELSPFLYSRSQLGDQTKNIRILSILFNKIRQSLKRNGGQINVAISALIKTHQRLMHCLANDSSVSISRNLTEGNTHTTEGCSTSLLALATIRQAHEQGGRPRYMRPTITNLFKQRKDTTDDWQSSLCASKYRASPLG